VPADVPERLRLLRVDPVQADTLLPVGAVEDGKRVLFGDARAGDGFSRRRRGICHQCELEPGGAATLESQIVLEQYLDPTRERLATTS